MSDSLKQKPKMEATKPQTIDMEKCQDTWATLRLMENFELRIDGKVVSGTSTFMDEPIIWFKFEKLHGRKLINFQSCYSSLNEHFSWRFNELNGTCIKDCMKYFKKIESTANTTKKNDKPKKRGKDGSKQKGVQEDRGEQNMDKQEVSKQKESKEGKEKQSGGEKKGQITKPQFQHFLFVKWRRDLGDEKSNNFLQLCLEKKKTSWYNMWLTVACGFIVVPEWPMKNGGSSKPCGKGNCNLCKKSSCMVSEQTEIKTPSRTIPLTHKLTCDDEEGIYVATCKQEGCGAQYVGKTKNPFVERWDDHKRNWGAFLGKVNKKINVAESSFENNSSILANDGNESILGNDDSVLENVDTKTVAESGVEKKENKECRNQNNNYGLAQHYKTSHETIFAKKPDMHTCYSLTFVDKLSDTTELQDLEFTWIFRICPIINKDTVTPSTKLHKNPDQ